MRRFVLALLTFAVVVSVAVPVLLLREADQRVDEADARNAAFSVAAEPTDTLPGRVFTARRTPVVLVVEVGRQRMALVADELGATLPDQSCLAMSIDGVDVGGIRESVPLIPASTMKLLTATAALEVLSPNATLSTVIGLDGTIDSDGVAVGDLWLVGGGDPLIATDGYAAAFRRQPQTYNPLRDIAALIAGAGITRIDGRVVGDESRYDTDRYVDSWPDRYITQNNIGPLSALSVNDGFSSFDGGLVHSSAPASWAAAALAAELDAIGVSVSGAATSGVAPDEITEIARFPSLPVSQMVAQLLTESDNNTAELLTKEIGRLTSGAGTTAAGTSGILEALALVGYDVGGVVANDGSGLDRGNLLTCGLLQQILDRAGPESVLAAGLAIGGRTGTLTNRFTAPATAGLVRAKTGFLNEVNGLAGFVDGADGHVLTFALITNGIPLDSELGFELQDQVVSRLVGEPVLPDVAALDLAGS